MLYELHADKNGTHLSNPRVLNKEVTGHNELHKVILSVVEPWMSAL